MQSTMRTVIPKKIQLIPLITLSEKLQQQVREIRNEVNIRKWMFTDHVIGSDEHKQWIQLLKQDSRQIVFAVLDDQPEVLGVVSVNAIDHLHKKAEWGIYLSETARVGLGSRLEYAIINFIFDELGMEKLNCQVIEGNDLVVRMHTKFGFQEEGFMRSNILKEGIRIGVHLLGLTKQEWLLGKTDLEKKYRKNFDQFDVTIRWKS